MTLSFLVFEPRNSTLLRQFSTRVIGRHLWRFPAARNLHLYNRRTRLGKRYRSPNTKGVPRDKPFHASRLGPCFYRQSGTHRRQPPLPNMFMKAHPPKERAAFNTAPLTISRYCLKRRPPNEQRLSCAYLIGFRLMKRQS